MNEMVIRDASNAGWMRVDPHSDKSYFGDMFLKPHPRKKDGGLIFSIPANMKPPVFGLVFNQAVWKKVEEIRDAEVCLNTIVLFHYLLKGFLLLHWQMFGRRSSQAESLPPNAALRAAFLPSHSKRKASSQAHVPHKIPRQDTESQSPKIHTVSLSSGTASSDDDVATPATTRVTASASGNHWNSLDDEAPQAAEGSNLGKYQLKMNNCP
jgi:hypothetical protein